jgi:hypothetical protein
VARRDAVLAPARAVLDGNLAEHRDAGVALLLAADRSETVALPEPPPELVVVGRDMHIKPLLPMLARNRRFHILALSAAQARLLTATPLVWEERALTALPPDAQAELDSRPAAEGDALDQARMALLTQEPRRIVHALRAALGSDSAPIVLAAEPHVAGRFMKAAHMPNLLVQTIPVNPFALTDAELHAKAVDLITPLIDAELNTVLDQVNARLGTAEPTVSLRPEEILTAAREGRVDAVVVAADDALWGSRGPDGTILAHGHQVPGDEDLLNLAAVATLRTGGRAFAVPVSRLPRDAKAAALLRF